MKICKTAFIAGILLVSLAVPTLTGCSGAGFDPSSPVTVISREAGSGTRGAFIELFGIEEKDADGNKLDKTVNTADISDSTGVVLASVASNPSAIGYISLGSLSESVKALKIDGAEATVENVKNGSYAIARPFNIATTDAISAAAQDFIAYILSSDGQAIVEQNDFIPLDGVSPYNGQQVSGKIVIAGSSSVTPLMEKLREGYIAVNPNATVEIQQSDSSSGMKSTIEGVCDIGMASRELKDSELEGGLTSTVIATDGIAVIVNPANTVDSLTKEQVKGIYTGEVKTWSDAGAQ